MRHGSPDCSLSRLICPRILRAQYRLHRGAMVPTFDLGSRRAAARHSGPASSCPRRRMTPAWSLCPAPAGQSAAPVVPAGLPSMGIPTPEIGGDFASLAGRFAAAACAGRAWPPAVAIGAARLRPPQGLPTQATLEVQVSLLADASETPGRDVRRGPTRPCRVQGQARGNRQCARRGRRAYGPAPIRFLARRATGDCYAGRRIVRTTGPTSTNLLDQINLDPRLAQRRGLRHARDPGASGGAHGPWEQAGELQRATSACGQLQMSMTVGGASSAHFTPLSDEARCV